MSCSHRTKWFLAAVLPCALLTGGCSAEDEEGGSSAWLGSTPHFKAEGALTLLSVSKPVTLAIEHFHCGIHPISKKNVCGADAVGTIKRSDFGMNAFLPAVGDEVNVRWAWEKAAVFPMPEAGLTEELRVD